MTRTFLSYLLKAALTLVIPLIQIILLYAAFIALTPSSMAPTSQIEKDLLIRQINGKVFSWFLCIATPAILAIWLDNQAKLFKKEGFFAHLTYLDKILIWLCSSFLSVLSIESANLIVDLSSANLIQNFFIKLVIPSFAFLISIGVFYAGAIRLAHKRNGL